MIFDVDGINEEEINKRVILWSQPDSHLASLTSSQREFFSQIIYNKNQNYKIEDDSSLECDAFNHIQKTQNWMDAVEREMMQCDAQKYKSRLAQLDSHLSGCKNLLSKVTHCIEEVDVILSDYAVVNASTASLRDTCESKLLKQNKITEHIQSLEKRLKFFSTADKLDTSLNLLNLQIAGESLRSTLDSLDECIEYMKSHPTYKESSSYLQRFKHMQLRAIGLIRARVTSTLYDAKALVLSLCDSVEPETAVTCANVSNNVSMTTDFRPANALVYGKFRNLASRLRPLIDIVEQRVDSNQNYEKLFEEIVQSYINQREDIVLSSVVNALQSLSNEYQNNHCSLLRNSCAFIVRLSEDEHQLYSYFFIRESQGFIEYMKQLCACLYDFLRPIIIHIQHLETLFEMCTILNGEMLQNYVTINSKQLSELADVLADLHRDVCERIVYRTHAYIRSDIAGYEAMAGDMAYPDKLILMQDIASQRAQCVPEAADYTHDSVSVSLSSVDMYAMWYPVVRRALLFISRLYRCVDRHTFQGLAYEALAACMSQLRDAALVIAHNQSMKDGFLFEIKHLLILREQVVPFQIDLSIKEIHLDMNKIKDAALSLVKSRSHIFSFSASDNALLEFLAEGSKAVSEDVCDFKRSIHERLKSVCIMFIQSTVHHLIAPLMFVICQIEGDTTCKIPLTDLSSAVTEFNKLIKSVFPLLVTSMRLYLVDHETEIILIQPIMTGVCESVQRIENYCTANYTSDECLQISCPSKQHLSLIFTSILAEPINLQLLVKKTSNSECKREVPTSI